MRRKRNAKIVATLGPASSNAEIIERLFRAGVDVFRFNFSHGTNEIHAKNYDTVRQVEMMTRRPVGTLLDLQGPKFRVGTFTDGSIELRKGDVFSFDLDMSKGNQQRVNLPHPEIFSGIEEGCDILIDDGRLQLRAKEVSPDLIVTHVDIGGKLSDNKGVNVPGVILPLSSLTEKDRMDLAFGLQLGVDWIALSFVQRSEDMVELRNIVNGRAKIIAKLEKPSAIDRLDAIVAESDAIMIARGDLGIEMPPEKVPSIQKRILRVCRKKGKPVIVATQMLDSMITLPIPTRAEAADVASAVYDGADAVMLSGETAVGRHPVESVSIMNSIIEEVEKDPYYRTMLDAAHPGAEETSADAICCAMRRVAGLLPVSATVTFTWSGFSSLRAARERPGAPILGLSPNLATLRYLTLVWGVHTVEAQAVPNVGEMVKQACQIAVKEGFANLNQPIVLVGGMPFGKPGTTNLLRVAWPDEELSDQ